MHVKKFSISPLTLCCYAAITFVLTLAGCGTPGTPAGSGFPSAQGPLVITAPGGSGLPRDVMHEVGPLETVWRIGKMYQVSPEIIMETNHLSDPSKLAVGQKLLIPNARPLRPVIPLYPTKKWTHIVIHHTATETGSALTINQIHHNRNFWNGLGYHFLIDNGSVGKINGQIETGPRWIKQMDGAHCNANGMNQHGIGISLVGNFSKTKVEQEQIESLVYLVDTLRKYYKIPMNNIVRHRDVPGKSTECPGNYFPWELFRQKLQSRR